MTFTTNSGELASSAAAPPCGVVRTRRKIARRKPAHSGFTLLEIVLVLAILVAMGALAWPTVTGSYQASKLKATADKVMAAAARARVQAMSTGQTQVLKFQLNAGKYTVEPLPDDSSTLDSTSTAATACKEYLLPEGYQFLTADRVQDIRAAVAESSITSITSNHETWGPPVLFYADGTCSEAQVVLANQTGRSITVSLRSLTGTAHLGEIMATPDTGNLGQPPPATPTR